jgi:hypothetical protein
VRLHSALIIIIFAFLSGCSSRNANPLVLESCGENQVQTWYFGGFDMYYGDCVDKAKDFGKICKENSECITKHCTVDQHTLDSDKCTELNSYTYQCPNIVGQCAATSQVGVATLLEEKNKVIIYAYQ